MTKYRPAAVVAVLALTAGWIVFRATPTPPPPPAAADVLVNGRPVARAWVNQQGVFVSVLDLMHAVEGQTANTRRLKVQGSMLVAVEDGACTGCSLRVRRAVQISSSVRFLPNGPHIPLHDLVRALEARLDTTVASRFDIHAGACSWCILAPQEEP